MERSINELFQISMKTLQDMIDVNTVVGDIKKLNDEVSVIPISKVKCSYVTGGIEQNKKDYNDSLNIPFGGATGGMLTIEPVAFLVVSNGSIEVLHLEDKTHLYEKIIDGSVEAINEVKKMITKK